MHIFRYIIILVAFIFTISCNNTCPEYSTIPHIDFTSATLTSDSSDYHIDFTFQLIDGDGNVGLSATDTISPFIDEYQQNFYAIPYYIENAQSQALPYSFSYRIPRLREDGNTKFINASISIDFTIAKSVFPYDSVFFTYYIYDRDLQQSNVDTSKVITIEM